MNVLSLFDGMSCGQQALDRLGIKVDNYYASEIDKYAIKITQKNYPATIQLGDVRDVKGSDLPDIDLILCGSPCQGFSFAGNQLAFDDPRSALFFEFIRILKECKPKYFLLENVRMKQEYIDIITDQVSECYPKEGSFVQATFFDFVKKIEPVLINSSLVSAQNRQRLYWTNIPNVTQPEDRGIALRDVLEDTVAEHYQAGEELQQNYKGGDFLNPNYKSQANTIHDIEGKSGTICAGTHGYANGYVSTPKQVGTAIDINGHDILKRVYSPDGKSPTLNTMGGGNRQPKVVTGAWRGRYRVDGVRQDHKGSVAGRTKQMLELRKDDKTNALTTVQKDNVVVEPEKMSWRKLSVVECERLQTVADDYTDGVSNTQRYKMLGNGMTVEVISHILSNVSPGQ
jgi:DNA (cytosine-5)-methyltransferase 3A|tara:strand:- start:4849 stop:6045 length:1197 start_codon:yes stop_codon:yes gene_type:complete